MKKISLRLRVTIVTAMVLSVFCVVLTFVSIYNANRLIISPLLNSQSDNVEDRTGDEEIPPAEKRLPNIWDTASDEEIIQGATGFTMASYVYMVAAVLLGSLIVYCLSGYALKPIKRLSEQIQNVDEKDLSACITDFAAKDELNKLAESFNGMMKRLETAFLREKRFSSDAAHELKTPLTVINTNLEVLGMNTNPTVEQYENVISIVKKQIDRMSSLVEDLFAISSMGGNRMDDVVEPEKLILEIVRELSPAIQKKSIQVTVDMEDCLVRANPVILKHGLSNIIENAIKYNIMGGSIHIGMSLNKSICIIKVRDTGIGIPPEKAEHIFEPFYRVDTSRSRDVGGAGLGLAIAKDIIELHGGTVEYCPGDEGGSEFIFQIPIFYMD